MNKLTIEKCILSPELNGGEGWITYSEKEGHKISGVVILTMEEYHSSKPSMWNHTSFDVQRCVRNKIKENTMEDSKIREWIRDLEEVHGYDGAILNVINALKAELPNKVWKPSEGDLGWVLSATGIVAESTNLTYSKSAYTQGSLSETEQEAIQERDFRAATKRVLDRVRELEQGEAVDWKDREQAKYFLRWRHSSLDSSCGEVWLAQARPTKYYSTDKAALEQVAEEMPDDVKLMIGVVL